MQPQSVTLFPRCKQPFTEPKATKWTISPELGKITDTGHYTAPGAIWLSQTVTVIALDVSDTEIGRALVTISSARGWMTLLGIFWALLSTALLFGIFAIWPPPARQVSLNVYPSVATLQKGETLQFLSSGTGVGDRAVVWAATKGEITPSGVFSASGKDGPITVTDGPITVTAQRKSDPTQTASAQVIIAPARLIITRSVVDASTTKNGDKIQFQAVGPDGPQSGLHWYLSGPGDLDYRTGSYTVRDKSAAQAIVTAVDPASTRRAAATVQLSSPDVVADDSSMLLLVTLMGGFGALLGAVRSFVNFVGSRSFVASWSFYYLFRPMFGAGLALIVFFAYRIGAISGPKGGSPADPFAAAFVAGMVGLFADTVLQKLKEIIEQLFRPQDARTDKLPGGGVAAAPGISKLTIDGRILTILGTGFVSGTSVSLNGTATQATFVDATKMTVALPAGVAGGTRLDVIVNNPDGHKSSTMTVTT